MNSVLKIGALALAFATSFAVTVPTTAQAEFTRIPGAACVPLNGASTTPSNGGFYGSATYICPYIERGTLDKTNSINLWSEIVVGTTNPTSAYSIACVADQATGSAHCGNATYATSSGHQALLTDVSAWRNAAYTYGYAYTYVATPANSQLQGIAANNGS